MIACMCTSASLFLTHSQLTWYISDIVPIIVILILLADIFWYSDIVWYFDILLYSFWYILLLWYSLIYFAIVNSLLYVLSVGLPTYNTSVRYQPSSSLHALSVWSRPCMQWPHSMIYSVAHSSIVIMYFLLPKYVLQIKQESQGGPKKCICVHNKVVFPI